jgi:NAD(P)-dependent dehydrogenase (short-subunit alcohol dehydrogenase family)
LGICAAFAERGDDVLAVCRRSTPELESLNVQVVPGVDVTNSAAVAKLPDVVGTAGLDVLVCNAGINLSSLGLEDLDVDACAREFDVNALGAIRVVLALLPMLREGSKIMLVGIGESTLNRKATSGANYGYRMSKSALTSFAFGLARDVRDRGIAVVVSNPGPVDTEMLRTAHKQGRTSYDPTESPSPFAVGRMLRDRIDELTLDDSPTWQRAPDNAAPAIP